MGQVRRMDMKEFKPPVYKVGEIAEKTVGIKQPLPMPVLPPSERPSRGKRPGGPRFFKKNEFEAQPGGVDTSQEIKVTPDMETELPDALPSVEQQPKRRRRRAQDQSLVNTNNLLGTGGSL